MHTEQGPQFQETTNYNVNYQKPNVAEVVSVKEWLIASLIMIIPIVNIIMMFVWAFGGNANPNKANYFKAALLMALIVLVLYIVLFVVIIGSFAASLN
ncbi:hypothetical protein [Paenibacillus terricola]|uniref:hypothetical protein n=1 Tax=Paenibacillus terricola TaxID=2763503 RepID=UPI001CD045AF|nr:hypothetical protein [Paenibacillus terricola]